MDKIILGILMLRKMTAYEIRNVIKNNFKSICSDSLGSIQAALKKLLALKMLALEELVEKGVNKKRYTITDIGQQALIEWIKIPMDLSKTKNMDLGKLLFMGYVPKEQQKKLLDAVILALEEEYRELKALKDSINAEEEKAAIEKYLRTDILYQDRISRLDENHNLSQSIKEISKFTLASLDYGIDIALFNIEWFEKLKERV